MVKPQISLCPTDAVPATAYDLACVQSWIAFGALPGAANDQSFLRGWSVFLDEDGALCLTSPTLEPPFAIMPVGSEYEVMVCDPDDMDVIGPFPTLRDAVDGIAAWLDLPMVILN